MTGREGFFTFTRRTDESNGAGRNSPRAAIAEMLEHNARLDIPLPVEVLKTARAITEKAAHPELFAENDE